MRLMMQVLVAVLLTATMSGCVTNSILRERGYAALNRGDHQAAQENFRAAIEREPDDQLAQYYLGLTHQRMNQPADAQLYFERALTLASEKLDPGFHDRIVARLAETYFAQEKYAQLTRFLEDRAQATSAASDYIRLAEYQVKIGDIDAAALAYKKAALFAGRTDPAPYLAVANFYRALRDPANERVALRYAYYVAPQNPEINERLRAMGLVPGPTAGLEPPKPEILQ